MQLFRRPLKSQWEQVVGAAGVPCASGLAQVIQFRQRRSHKARFAFHSTPQSTCTFQLLFKNGLNYCLYVSRAVRKPKAQRGYGRIGELQVRQALLAPRPGFLSPLQIPLNLQGALQPSQPTPSHAPWESWVLQFHTLMLHIWQHSFLGLAQVSRFHPLRLVPLLKIIRPFLVALLNMLSKPVDPWGVITHLSSVGAWEGSSPPPPPQQLSWPYTSHILAMAALLVQQPFVPKTETKRKV